MSKKILYVDDEQINLDLFRLTFRKKYEVVIALSGREGIEYVKSDRDIAMVFSDMKMPSMNGLEFISEVKNINPELPCAILSGYEKTPQIASSLEEGVIVDYFRKPFDRNEVEKLIFQVFQGEK